MPNRYQRYPKKCLTKGWTRQKFLWCLSNIGKRDENWYTTINVLIDDVDLICEIRFKTVEQLVLFQLTWG